MGSLKHCLGINSCPKPVADEIRATQQEYLQDGVPSKEATERAVRDMLKKVNGSRTKIIDQINKQMQEKAPEHVMHQEHKVISAVREETGEDIEQVDYNGPQKETVDKLAKKFGKRVIFFKGSEKSNGFFNSAAPDTIFINADNEDMVLFTFGHELIHSLKNDNHGLYVDLFKQLFDHVNDFDSFYEAYNANRKKQNLKELSPVKVAEEFFADFSGEQFTDPKFWEQLSENNPTLFEKLADLFNKILAQIDDVTGTHFRKISEAQDALKSVLETYSGMTKTAQQTATAGVMKPNVNVDVGGDSLSPGYSIRTWNDEEKALVMDTAKKLGISTSKARKWIRDIDNVAARVLNNPELDFDAEYADEFDALKANSDPHYTKSVDFSTLCRKRYVLAATIEAIQVELGQAVTKDNWVVIHKMLEDRGLPVSCGACYVDSKRMEEGVQINKFLALHPDLDPAQFLTQRGVDQVRRENPKLYKEYKSYAGRNNSKTSESRTDYKGEIRKYFIDGLSDGTTSPTGKVLWGAVKNLAAAKKRVEAFNRRSGLRWQSWSDFELVHLLDAMQVILDMSEAGLKGHAYTKVPEFVEAFGNTGLMINVSLIPKGNGFNKDGSLNFDPIQGVPFEKAMDLRDRFPETVGTIAIAVSNEHAKALMADPRIDFIIPYHRSGMKKEIAAVFGMSDWSDFTDNQTEDIGDYKLYHKKVGQHYMSVKNLLFKKLYGEYPEDIRKVEGDSKKVATAKAKKRTEFLNKTVSDPKFQKKVDKYLETTEGQKEYRDKAKKYAEPEMDEWWDDTKSGDENAKEYLRICKDRGITPKFREVKYADHQLDDMTQESGYWKTLIDRKSFNNVGENIIQKPVVPEYITEPTPGYKSLNDLMDEYEPTQTEADPVTVKNFMNSIGETNHSIRRKSDPKKTIKAYKLFRMKKSKKGKLFPLYIDSTTSVPVGEWLDADIGNNKKAGLALRPGWHMGDSPAATHIGGRAKNAKRSDPPAFREADTVWAEVEVADDVDWQSEANKRARRLVNDSKTTGLKKGDIDPRTAEITDQIPTDGNYRYKTNPNMTGEWIIGGSIKVNRLLDDAEVEQINKEAGVKDLPRREKLDLDKYGFGEGTKFSVKQAEHLQKLAHEDKEPFLDAVKKAAKTVNGNLPEGSEKFAVKSNVNRIAEKLAKGAAKGKPHNQRVTDVLRSTILTANPDSAIRKILRKLHKDGYYLLKTQDGKHDLDNLYEKNTPGYKHIAIKVVKETQADPLVREVLVMTPNMFWAKEKFVGHKLYEIMRQVQDKYEEGSLTRDGEIAYEKMEAYSKWLYSLANTEDSTPATKLFSAEESAPYGANNNKALIGGVSPDAFMRSLSEMLNSLSAPTIASLINSANDSAATLSALEALMGRNPFETGEWVATKNKEGKISIERKYGAVNKTDNTDRPSGFEQMDLKYSTRKIPNLRIVEDNDGNYDAFVGKRRVANVTLNSKPADSNHRTVYKASVLKNYQHQGIATQVYDFIEQNLALKGQTFGPSNALTDDGFGFWKQRNPAALGESMRLHEDELIGKTIKLKDGKTGKIKSVADTVAIVSIDGSDRTTAVPFKTVDAQTNIDWFWKNNNKTQVSATWHESPYKEIDDSNVETTGTVYSTRSYKDVVNEKFKSEDDAKVKLTRRVAENIRDFVRADSLGAFKDKLRTLILDKYAPINKVLGQQIYRMHRMLGNSAATIGTFLQHGPLHWQGDVLSVKDKDSGFAPWFKSLGKDGHFFLHWVAAKRAEKLTESDRENWLDKDSREAIFQEAKDRGLSDSQLNAWNDKLQEFNKNVVDIAVEAGLVDPEARKRWMSEYYLPFYRIMETEGDEDFVQAPISSKRYISSGIKALKGGESMLGDPLQNIVRNWSHLITESQRQKARFNAGEMMVAMGIGTEMTKGQLTKVLGVRSQYGVRVNGENISWKPYEGMSREEVQKVVDETPGASLIEKQMINSTPDRKKSESVMSYMRNGKPVYLKVDDPELYMALTQVNMDAVNHGVIMGAAWFKRVLTYGATFGASFRIANFVRDTIHTSVVSKSFLPVVDSFKGLMKVWRESPEYIELMASGGGFSQGYLNSADPAALARSISELSEFDKKRILDKPKKLLDFWERVGHASEMAARVQIYSNMKKAGQAELDAAFEARDILDFALGGQSQAVRVATAVIPFLNARMQGLDRLARGYKNDPRNFILKGGVVAAASLALWAMYRDDDRYKELEDWDKWQYHHFWIGKEHYRIPKAFEVGAIFSTAFESAAATMVGDESFNYLIDTMAFTFTNTFAVGLPAALGPLDEIRRNRSSFTGRPIESYWQKQMEPGSRFDPWDPEILKIVGRKANVSPKMMNTLIRGYTSTIGTMFMSIADFMLGFSEDVDAPKKYVHEYLGLDRFMTDKVKNTKYATRYFDFADEAVQTFNTIENYKKMGDIEMAKNKIAATPDYQTRKRLVNRTRKRIGAIRKQELYVWLDKHMDPTVKRKRLDYLRKQKNAVYKAAYKQILQLKK